MAKLNLVSTLNQMREESLSNVECHPYYGLKDNKGWLTRYPEESCLLSYQWMREFVFHSGSCDSYSVYGIAPHHDWLEEWSPRVIAMLLQIEGRWDNVVSLSRLTKAGIEIDESISYQDLRVLVRGYRYMELLWDFGFKAPHPVMTMGHKFSWYSLGQWIAKQVTKNPELLADDSLRYQMFYVLTEDEDPFQAHQKGMRTGLIGSYTERCVKKWLTRQEAMYNRVLSGSCMSLKDIREVNCWCFYGVKRFLAQEMPHVHRLIADTENWEALEDKEVYKIRWHLISRDLITNFYQY
jgi:hypothetical protein